MTTAHRALREATRDRHDAVDAAFARFDLADVECYRAFLEAHARALLPVETALAGWSELFPEGTVAPRGLALAADLSDLGVAADGLERLPPPRIEEPEAAWGAAYVLEGSRLGAALLVRAVGGALPRRYLASAHPQGAWQKFLKSLNGFIYRDDQAALAIASAERVFDMFTEAVLRSGEQRARTVQG